MRSPGSGTATRRPVASSKHMAPCCVTLPGASELETRGKRDAKCRERPNAPKRTHVGALPQPRMLSTVGVTGATAPRVASWHTQAALVWEAVLRAAGKPLVSSVSPAATRCWQRKGSIRLPPRLPAHPPAPAQPLPAHRGIGFS